MIRSDYCIALMVGAWRQGVEFAGVMRPKRWKMKARWTGSGRDAIDCSYRILDWNRAMLLLLSCIAVR